MSFDLNILWFILIAVLYIGFFVLEGFDFGVGLLLPVLGRTDIERRAIINTIGPHWDGNEVWLLTAGGATFAAFPNWYATFFSGFYLPLFLVLFGLIIRGVAFEFRSKSPGARWRQLWDVCIFVGSLLPALLLGVAFANLTRGVAIDANMNMVGSVFDLLNGYSLLGGVAGVLLFATYGAVFLNLKLTGDLAERAAHLARRLWPIAAVAEIAYFLATYASTDLLTHIGINPGPLPFAMIGALLVAGLFILRRRLPGWTFALLAFAIAAQTAFTFGLLFPRVMVSSLDPAYSLTIYTAASSPYTLTVMTVVALFFVPIIIGYQAWTYWVFRKRVEAKPEGLVY